MSDEPKKTPSQPAGIRKVKPVIIHGTNTRPVDEKAGVKIRGGRKALGNDDTNSTGPRAQAEETDNEQ